MVDRPRGGCRFTRGPRQNAHSTRPSVRSRTMSAIALASPGAFAVASRATPAARRSLAARAAPRPRLASSLQPGEFLLCASDKVRVHPVRAVRGPSRADVDRSLRERWRQMLRRWEGEEEDDEDRELWREMSERPGKWLGMLVGFGVALWAGVSFLFAASPITWYLVTYSLVFLFSGAYIFAVGVVAAAIAAINTASFAAGSAYLPWLAVGVGAMIAASVVDVDAVFDDATERSKDSAAFDAFGLDVDDDESDSNGGFRVDAWQDGPLPAEMCATYDAYVKWNGRDRLHVAPNGVQWRGVRVPREDVEVRTTRGGYVVEFAVHCPNATSEHAEEGEGGRGLAERFELSFVRRGKGREADFEGTFARETEGPLPVILEKKHGVLNEAYDAVAANEAKALAANRRPRDALDEFYAFDVRLLGNPRTWDAGDVQTWLEAEGMEHLKPEFRAQEVDGDTLLALTSADMRELGVSAMPARKKLARALERLRRFDDE